MFQQRPNWRIISNPRTMTRRFDRLLKPVGKSGKKVLRKTARDLPYWNKERFIPGLQNQYLNRIQAVKNPDERYPRDPPNVEKLVFFAETSRKLEGITQNKVIPRVVSSLPPLPDWPHPFFVASSALAKANSQPTRTHPSLQRTSSKNYYLNTFNRYTLQEALNDLRRGNQRQLMILVRETVGSETSKMEFWKLWRTSWRSCRCCTRTVPLSTGSSQTTS